MEMLYLITILFIFIFLVVLNKRILNKKSFSYSKKDFLLSRSEHEFYDALIQAVGHEYYIFPQIHLSQLVEHRIKGQNWTKAFYHVNAKSVDFVLCDKSYISPKLVIELDEKSHNELDRQERDKIVEDILKQINLPFLRIWNHGAFNPAELAQQIKTKISSSIV
jgi:very-short-patch-repair endonuclease